MTNSDKLGMLGFQLLVSDLQAQGKLPVLSTLEERMKPPIIDVDIKAGEPDEGKQRRRKDKRMPWDRGRRKL